MRTYNSVVTGTDFSEVAQTALRAAVEMARRFESQRLHVVHVLVRRGLPMPANSSEEEKAVKAAEDRLRAMELGIGSVAVTREVRVGIAARELAEAADRAKADLIVIASHGHGQVRRLLLGSVPSSLVRVAHCPVLIVGENRSGCERFEHVLAAIDLSPVSLNVLSHAVAMAKASGGRVTALSLFEPPFSSVGEVPLLPRTMSGEELEKLRQTQGEALHALAGRVPRAGVPMEIEVSHRAPPATAILEHAARTDVDLVVVGSSGHNAWHRMILGSTATRVLAEAPCPVLVVPQTVRERVREKIPAELELSPEIS